MSEATQRPATESTASPVTTRRTLLCGAAAVLAAGGTVAVAGCSSSSDASSSSAKPATPVEVGPASDVPVGGGKVYRDQKIVVTQPTAGEYKAFSAKCTHAGCIVDQVKNAQIQCPCHGSRFAIADGAVQDGPAPSPLPAYKVAVQDGKLQVTTS
ncbi:Rieske (2Fe-2S) protein [Kitasatospora atroaurantiaca]|uniref:Cytochrome bc1 complex Rieske iron-sulfur subunit n=1 Tax=Kitasatospora atroaurantiaca TaxID=285545 RepID=A0A561EWQ1_9ACTN|nr:Rieske (2Fe-2S) protein [Kitasatospora atroaurantiaca]TWE20042.1 nitrite reductase/ring-hydroxylating ferredoxin subunit [Kitasatospora atroaurantiaca]